MPAVPPHLQPVLQHANSMTSSQPSKQLQMALKLSKMEKYIRKHALEVGGGSPYTSSCLHAPVEPCSHASHAVHGVRACCACCVL